MATNALPQCRDAGTGQLVIAEPKQPQSVVDVRLLLNGILHPGAAPLERLRQAMLDEHRPERPAGGEVDLTIEMDVAELPLSDIEVSAIHLRPIVEEPVRRGDDAGPGPDF